MRLRFAVSAALAAALAFPAAAANGPVVDHDFQCFSLMAVAEYAVREQINDPKTPADQRSGLEKGRTALRSKSDWYLARISTLPAEKRGAAEFERARTATKGLDKDAFNALFDSCMTGMDADRLEALKLLLS